MRKFHSLIKTVAIALLGLGLASCLPSHEFNAQINTAADVNPNHAGRPSPVVVMIYQLKDKKIFENADFFNLYKNGKQVLGEDYISQRELELIPDRDQAIDFPLEADAKYVGVVAAFSDLDNKNWRSITALSDSWGTESVVITLDEDGVSINR